MCYTAEASVYSFIVGITVSSYLYTQPSSDLKIIGGFFFFVTFMQLFDYVFWRTQPPWNTETKDTNRLFTKIACIANNIQPLVLAYLIYKYKGSVSGALGPVKGENIVYLYGLVMVLFMMSNWKSLDTTTVGKDRSLYWSWNHWEYSEPFYILFLITLLYLSYYNLSGPYNNVLPFIILFSFIVTYFKYGVEVYGRFWCYFAPFIPIVFLFIR
jgi:hypothetical protein